MKAYWRQGSKFSIDPTKAYTELERIKDKNAGVLTASIVVEAAKSKRSPLHKEIYRLDDAEAAHEHRLEISRKMLRSIELVYEEAPEHKARAYEVVTQPARQDVPERNVYRTTEEILSDPVLRDELLARAIRDAIAYRKRYHSLSQLSQVFTAIDKFLQRNEVV